MAISWRADARLTAGPRPGRQAGFTLFEMMVALAVGAVLAAGLAGLSRTMSPRVELRAAAERIAGDLERARLEARRTGAPVAVTLSEAGYVIEALELSGDWGGAQMTHRRGPLYAGALTVSPAPFTAEPLGLELSRDGLSAHIDIAAASGRVEARIHAP